MLKIHALLVSSTRFDAKSWLHSRRIMERLQCNLLFFFQWTSEVFLINFRLFFLISLYIQLEYFYTSKEARQRCNGWKSWWLDVPETRVHDASFYCAAAALWLEGAGSLTPTGFYGFFLFSSHLASPLLSYQHLRVFKQMPAQQLCVPVRVSTMQHGQTPGSRRSSRLDLS